MGSSHFPHPLFDPLTFSVVMVTLPWVAEQPHQHGTFRMWSSSETVILQCYIGTQKPSRSFLGLSTMHFYLLLDFTIFLAHPNLLLQHHRSLRHQHHSWFSKCSPFVLPLKFIIMFCVFTDFPGLIWLSMPWFYIRLWSLQCPFHSSTALVKIFSSGFNDRRVGEGFSFWFQYYIFTLYLQKQLIFLDVSSAHFKGTLGAGEMTQLSSVKQAWGFEFCLVKLSYRFSERPCLQKKKETETKKTADTQTSGL